MGKKYDHKALIRAARAYTEMSPLPIVAQFARQQGISRRYLYELAAKDPELKEELTKMVEKKEIQLEIGAITGKIPVAFAIFSLKQLGWRDVPKEETAVNDNGKIDLLIEAVKNLE